MNEQSYKKRMLIVKILLALFVVLVIGIIVIVISGNKNNKQVLDTQKGNAYIKDMDYANAIIEYEKALKIDKNDAEAYQKLVVLYESEGRMTKAEYIAKKGYDVTGNTTLKRMLENIKNSGSCGYSFSAGTALLVKIKGESHLSKKNEKTYVLNIESISDDVINSNLKRLEQKYGGYEVKKDGNTLVAMYEGVTAVFPESLTMEEYNEGYLTDFWYVSYSYLNSVFLGYEENDVITYDQLTKIFEQKPKKENSNGFYYISVDYYGMNFVFTTDKNYNITDSSGNIKVFSLNVDEEKKKDESNIYSGSVTGRIRDALTGDGKGSVHLKFRKGFDEKTGDVILECDTKTNGEYYAKLDEGNYCAEITSNGYITQYENISVTRNVSATGKDYTISQKLESGEIRIVLEWDATPNDLDSHLIGKTDSGVDVNVNFNNKKSNYNGKELASLDLDDVDGFGPETTTIKDIDGVYDFYVFDYTKSSTMANGNARVTVYLPDNTVQVVNINKSAGIANEWNVLHIDHGIVSTVNTSSSVLNDSADTW